MIMAAQLRQTSPMDYEAETFGESAPKKANISDAAASIRLRLREECRERSAH